MLNRREDFGLFCERRGVRCAVEVGTHKGLFAREFLQHYHNGHLWCVDTWDPYPHMPFGRLADLIMAVVILSPFADRCTLIRAPSVQAAIHLADTKPGFVYIDADHTYESVRDDIAAWWVVLIEGGVLAGHDYQPDDPDMGGLVKAVDEFVAMNGLTLNLTNDPETYPSWWVEKPRLEEDHATGSSEEHPLL